MKKNKRKILTALTVNSLLIIAASTSIVINESFNIGQAISGTNKNYDIKILPNTPGLPIYPDGKSNSGTFTVYSTSGNPFVFYYKDFGVSGNSLGFKANTGCLYNLTPIDNLKKITTPALDPYGRIHYISYGYENVYNDWQPGYQLTGGINYTVKEKRQVYHYELVTDDKMAYNVFKVHGISTFAMYLKNVTLNYNCAQ